MAVPGLARGGKATAPAMKGISTAVLSDKRTVKQKMSDAQARQDLARKGGGGKGSGGGGTKAPDTSGPINGGIGGQDPVPPTTTQTIAEAGGGLGGPRTDGPKVTTTNINGGLGGQDKPNVTTTKINGGLGFKGNKTKQPTNAVIDKRSVKQKLKDAQTRRNS